MPLATDNDLISLFSGGQFNDEPIEDEVMACFTDGQFGSELAAAIVVPRRRTPRTAAGGGGGGWSPRRRGRLIMPPVLVPCSVDIPGCVPGTNYQAWVPPWEAPPLPPPPWAAPPPLPPPPPPQASVFVPPLIPLDPALAGAQDTRSELPWKAIAFGAVGILVGIVIAKTVLKESK